MNVLWISVAGINGEGSSSGAATVPRDLLGPTAGF
jgi:hypothetical protein